MKNFNGEIIIRPKSNGKTKTSDIASKIHNQLVGNEDYIDSNIGVFFDNKEVLVWFDNCKKPIPEITL